MKVKAILCGALRFTIAFLIAVSVVMLIGHAINAGAYTTSGASSCAEHPEAKVCQEYR